MEKDLSILPSIIILKNSIIEGRIPLETDLEVGELALNLYEGKEDIFAKNSSGEVVSLRTPREDLFWGDLFLKYDTVSDFQKDLDDGKIKDTSIVYIKDEQKIWTDGEFFCSKYTEEEIEQILESKLIVIPDKVYNLTTDSDSDTISKAFNGPENFTEIINRSISSNSISLIKLPDGGSSPVSLIPKITSLTESELRIEWVSYGNYIIEIVKLTNGSFTIEKTVIELSTFNDIKEKVDNIYDFNKKLAPPVISGSWELFGQDKSPIMNPDDLGINLSSKNLILEQGFYIKFSGTYSWSLTEDGMKSPQKVENGNWTALTEEGISSEMYQSDFISTDTDIFIKLSAPKTGLVVDGTNVVLATGNDYSEDKYTVSFIPGKSYWGVVNNIDITEDIIKQLSNSEFKQSKELSVKSISLNKNEYFIYSYPKKFGDLDTITQDKVQPVMGAFRKEVINLINNADQSIEMNVYITNNPGAFTNSELIFN